MKATRVPEVHCPSCNAKLNGAVDITIGGAQQRPSAGNFCVCGYCGETLRFNDDGSVRTMQVSDWRDMRMDDAVRLACAAGEIRRRRSWGRQ